MTASWPGSLPQKPLLGFTEQRQRNLAMFSPDVGPPKMRRRSTAVPVNSSITLKLTDTQLATFDLFFEVTLADGTLPFTWPHPRTGINYSWIFSPQDAPQKQALTKNVTQVTFKLLQLP